MHGGGESFLSTRFNSASLFLPVRLGIAGSITRRSSACETTSAIGPLLRSFISFPRSFIIGGTGIGMNRHFYGECYIRYHSARRLEIVTSFYKHPVEILVNSILSSLIVYPLFGASVRAAGYYTVLIAVGEFFYHWNIKTPSWIGFIFQRPESHRVHHQFRHHTNNFADIPFWDMLFGTFKNPKTFKGRCGYERWREDRFEDMLLFRDVHAPGAEKLAACLFGRHASVVPKGGPAPLPDKTLAEAIS